MLGTGSGVESVTIGIGQPEGQKGSDKAQMEKDRRQKPTAPTLTAHRSKLSATAA